MQRWELMFQRQTPLRITRRVVMSFVYLVCHGERGIVQSWVDVWGFGLGAGHGKKEEGIWDRGIAVSRRQMALQLG